MDIKLIIIVLILGYTVYCILEDSIKRNITREDKEDSAEEKVEHKAEKPKRKETKSAPVKEKARPTVISDSDDDMLVQRQGSGYNGQDEELPDFGTSTEVMDQIEEIEQQAEQQIEQQTEDKHISISVTVNNNSEDNKPKTTKCSYCGRIVKADGAGGICPYCNGVL